MAHAHDRIERATLKAWPAACRETRFGWEFCASEGYSGRVNSIWPLAWTDETVPELAFAHAVIWCGQYGIDPCFRLSDGLVAPPELPTLLRAAKYAPENETLVMTRRIQRERPLRQAQGGAGGTSAPPTMRLPEPVEGGARTDVELLEIPDDSIWSPLGAAAPSPGDFNERRAIVERITAPHVFARASLDDKPAAIGLGVMTSDLLGIYLMRTAPDSRRRGLARNILRALLDWGAANGATEAYLQVEKSNPSATALYESEGFAARYSYWYWRLTT